MHNSQKNINIRIKPLFNMSYNQIILFECFMNHRDLKYKSFALMWQTKPFVSTFLLRTSRNTTRRKSIFLKALGNLKVK